MEGSRSRRDGGGETRDKRAIVDLRDLEAELAAVIATDLPAEELRARLVATLKAAMTRGDEAIRRHFETELSGTQAVRERCYLVDQILRTVYDFASEHLYPLGSMSSGERLALVAVGGYGRGELAPYSDVDLLFLMPYKVTPRSEQVIESTLYLLWDLGFKVGHAVRSVDDCMRQAKADMTIRTNLLEKRFLCGDRELFQELWQRYQKALQGGPNNPTVRPCWEKCPRILRHDSATAFRHPSPGNPSSEKAGFPPGAS